MIPERLFQSIANCRTWLARRARPASGRISQTRGRRHGTRPELFVLEDRCLLTTASYVISGSAIAFDKGSTGLSATALAEAMEYASSLPAQSNRVVVMVVNGNTEFPFGIIGYGTLSQITSSGSYTLTLDSPVEMPNDFPSMPTSSQPSGGVFIIVPPMPQNPPPQTPVMPDASRPLAWWSQTSHPTSGVLLILANPNGAVSSVPAAQPSTPVALFLQQPQSAADPGPARLVGDVTVLDRASDMFALAASASTSRMTERNLTAWIARNLAPGRNGPGEVDEVFSENALAVAPFARPLAAPTKSELLALTDKILEEYAPLPSKGDEPKDVISMQAVAACAAVQTAWLLLRHVAIARTKKLPTDQDQQRGWSWKTAR